MSKRFTCSDDGRHIYDAHFGYDVRIDLDGDWEDQERIDYAIRVCQALEADPPPVRRSAEGQ